MVDPRSRPPLRDRVITGTSRRHQRDDARRITQRRPPGVRGEWPPADQPLGPTGLEPATSGVTRRDRLNRHGWLRPRINAKAAIFVSGRTSCDPLRPATTGQSLCGTCVVRRNGARPWCMRLDLRTPGRGKEAPWTRSSRESRVRGRAPGTHGAEPQPPSDPASFSFPESVDV
jgi:hypothetical protein